MSEIKRSNSEFGSQQVRAKAAFRAAAPQMDAHSAAADLNFTLTLDHVPDLAGSDPYNNVGRRIRERPTA